MKYNRPTSYSQNDLFYTCPRTWYMKYIQKIPGIDDLTYAYRGSIVHHCLENYYPDKKMTILEVKEFFKKEWIKYKLDKSFLANKKDETWLMVLNGINLDLDVTSTELKIYYPDVVGYIDVVNTKTGEIRDWKSSTRAHYNESSYIQQVKFYAWLFYRKFNRLPSYTGVEYLKYIGTKSELGCVPTMEDIEAAEKWHNKAREQMEYYMDHPEKLPPFNQEYIFCPYKHLWDLEFQDPADLMSFTIDVYGNFIYIKGPVDDFLSKHLDKKYSYELKTAKYIKKYTPNVNTIIRFWKKSQRRLPIGFLQEVMKTLHDYAEVKHKNPVITINDKRIFDKTVVKMPNKLLSGKILRPYQEKAVDTYVNRNKIGALEIITGGGKSLISAEIIRRLGIKTLFVVDKKHLLHQIKDTFEENLGIPIGVIGDGVKDIQEITVATIQTLTRMIDNNTKNASYLKKIKQTAWDKYADINNIYDYLDTPLYEIHNEDLTDAQVKQQIAFEMHAKRQQSKFYKEYVLTSENIFDYNEYRNKTLREHNMICAYLSTIRLATFDEAHHGGSQSYYGLGTYLTNTEYRLSLTATFKRDDGNDMMMHATCGYTCFKLTGQELIEKGYLMKPIINFVKYDISNETIQQMEKMSLLGLINEVPNYQRFYPNLIVRNEARNKVIKTIIELNVNKSILILVKLIEHGDLLEKLIPNSIYIHGSTPSKKRTQTLKDFKSGKIKILISTISIFAEGVDIPLLDVVINAAANKGDIKSIQVLGRVLRKCDGKLTALYYDFTDKGTFFYTASRARIKAFRAEGHSVSFIELK